MLIEITKKNRECYKEQLYLLSSLDKILSLVEKNANRPRRLFCENEKDYVGDLHLYLMRMLLYFRDDPKCFESFLMSVVNTNTNEDDLDRLASDMIYFLFTDFTSNERTVLNILRHFEYLIKVNC